MVELREVLAIPAVAVLLGLLIGVALISPVLLSSRMLASGNVDAVLPIVLGSVFGGMLLALGILFGYDALARTGFVYFGASLIAGYMLALAFGAFALLKKFYRTDDEARS